jgi:fatty-acyl-CoA synthase
MTLFFDPGGGGMQAQGIGYWLTKRAFLHEEREAVVDGQRRLSYARLNQRVNQLAHALESMGLNTGDRVALLAYNCVEYVETIFATAKLGLILVPLNWRLSPKELAFNLTDSQTETLIFDAAFQEAVDEIKRETPLRQMLVLGATNLADAQAYETALAAQPVSEPSPAKGPGLDSDHIIMYTAGTTGRPKGAVLSQGASFWNAINLEVDMNFTPKDRNLSVLPMFHIGGIGLFTLPILHCGGTVVIQRIFDPVETLELLQEEKITLFFGVPAIFLFIIQHVDFDPQAFERVRLVMSGGAPLPLSLVEQYKRAGITMQQGFGMSEAAPSIATLDRESALAKAGSIGKPLLHVEAQIVDDHMQPLPCGEIGELVIRGPNLMRGYWNRPQATREAFEGGWFHSGDLARMDDQGYLHIVERKKDMFISGGENVYPAEVENAIFALDKIAENAVIGVKDKRWGEVGVAVVALKPNQYLSQEQILAHLKERLATFKVPKRVVFVEHLPRNAAGKVLKNVLRDRYAQPA